MAERPNNIHVKTRDLQHKLYQAAKLSPNRRFHALYDRVLRRDVLWSAWLEVRDNQGAPGVDALTIADIEAEGVEDFLDGIEAELRDGTYRPKPVRRVWIPKPGKAELRPLGVAAIRDRVVQAALKIVLEPIFEADFLPCSFGFRPKKDAHQALHAVREAVREGRVWVVDADIESFFDRLGFDVILDSLRERVSDRRVLGLIRRILGAGVLDGKVLSYPGEGAPQGGPLSPLLANAVLHRLDRAWTEQYGRLGVLIRYADDEVICCPTKERAEAALAVLSDILAGLGLRLSASKTRIVCVAGGDDSFEFLGYHHQMVPTKKRPDRRHLARWPTDKAMLRARSRIREMTRRSRCHIPTEVLVGEINQFLRGWGQYYRFGQSTRRFKALDEYVVERMALLLSKRHGRAGRGHGLKHIVLSGNRLGLVRLSGTVVYG
jgi:group II intron reverse transcriptase/maturase